LKIIKREKKEKNTTVKHALQLQPCAYTRRTTHKTKGFTKLPTCAIHRHKYRLTIVYFKVIFFKLLY